MLAMLLWVLLVIAFFAVIFIAVKHFIYPNVDGRFHLLGNVIIFILFLLVLIHYIVPGVPGFGRWC